MKWETKKAWIIAAIGVVLMGLLVFALSGCSAEGGSGNIFTSVTEVSVDGRMVTCITYAGKGISCDW